MKRFRGFVKKEFIHIFRDVRTLLILFGMPVAQILIFGYVVTNEIKEARIAVYDKSNDHITREITDKLVSSDYFILSKNIRDHREIEKTFEKGEIKEIIVFEQNFAEKLTNEKSATVQILLDATDANMANLLQSYTSGIIRDYSRDIRVSNNEMPQMVIKPRMLFNNELRGVYMFVPGTMALILMLVTAMMTSISITREKEMGTMEVLLVSPLKSIQIIAGKVFPYVFLAFLNGVTIIALGYFVFGMPVNGSLILLLLETLLYIIMSLSLGIFISTISNSQQMAMFISMFALLLPTMLLSGFIFPTENMPWPLQWLSTIIPAKYYIILIKNIMIKGTGLLYIWKETLVLLLMTGIFIGLSIKNFKIRLE
ncbi:MAG: ABC transporter permease [Bacteroidales bacterium]|nr:ABC transporter permease [Bacteroidales bacterium]MBS3774342.1 ABC transporter permease [Bacteroidales bacterium]